MNPCYVICPKYESGDCPAPCLCGRPHLKDGRCARGARACCPSCRGTAKAPRHTLKVSKADLMVRIKTRAYRMKGEKQ